MNQQSVALLLAEPDRLSKPIEASGDHLAEGLRAQRQPGKKRRLSAAGRKAMAQAARRRWLRLRPEKGSLPDQSGEEKGDWGMRPAGRQQ